MSVQLPSHNKQFVHYSSDQSTRSERKAPYIDMSCVYLVVQLQCCSEVVLKLLNPVIT